MREHQRLCLVQQHLIALEAKSRAEIRAPARGSVEGKINHLVDLRGIGVVGGHKLMHEVFLPRVRQSPPGWQFFRADQFGLRQWNQPSRSRYQQSGQPARPHTGGRARMVVAALPARERAEPLVPRAGRSSQGPYPAHCHRGARPQADGRLVALYHHWRSPHRRRKPPEHLNGRAQ